MDDGKDPRQDFFKGNPDEPVSGDETEVVERDDGYFGKPITAELGTIHRPKIYLVTAWTVFVATVLMMLVVGVLFFAGAFDQYLASAGLATRDCAVNSSGTVLCGEQLEGYEKLLDEQQKALEEADIYGDLAEDYGY